ncbi:cupin domain-containing protein [Oceanicoccus sagamiensis]|uniref:Cupin type-2 domain-containing protein n=1 Tax=Oceanicoccus sagamiensis TaxID=716816 RepID=A0A1X9NA15_9GAMM|nr:cupin domain-containing protein [Oceanicoccus sagamiensis]ARN73904.1 hypothetical protein BST96_07115 [Oceanicoccus sagamiensis]
MIISSLDKLDWTEVSHNPRVQKKQILDNSVCPQLGQFAQAIFPPGETAPAHSHANMTEVFFVQSGRGIIIVEGKEIPLSPQTTVTVQPNESHEVINNSTEDLIVLFFGICH